MMHLNEPKWTKIMGEDAIKPEWTKTAEGIEQQWIKCCETASRCSAFFPDLLLGARLERLFAVACCREVWLLLSESSRKAVIVAERFADGLASQEELAAAAVANVANHTYADVAAIRAADVAALTTDATAVVSDIVADTAVIADIAANTAAVLDTATAVQDADLTVLATAVAARSARSAAVAVAAQEARHAVQSAIFSTVVAKAVVHEVVDAVQVAQDVAVDSGTNVDHAVVVYDQKTVQVVAAHGHTADAAIFAARTADVRSDAWKKQGVILASIIGPGWEWDLSWATTTVVAMAQNIYDSQDFSSMPILADALQDAGCEEPSILNPLRDPNYSWYRGCRVLDEILGKRREN